MNSNYSLLFFMKFQAINTLVEGRLLLLKNNELIDKFIATSGCPGFQHKEAQDDKGKGCIPENYGLVNKSYQVNTNGIYQPTKGIEGNFYLIEPISLNINGVQRGEFGIHRDANAPGSAGCIVLRTLIGWETFQKQMEDLVSQKIMKLPLVVAYL